MPSAFLLQVRAKGIPLRVGIISPGVTKTEFALHARSNQENADEAYSKFRCLEAEDVAQAVLWYLSLPDHVDVNDVQMRSVEQVN